MRAQDSGYLKLNRRMCIKYPIKASLIDEISSGEDV